MASLRQVCVLGVSIAMAGFASGCNMVHDLQWHRLWRMNYGTGSSSDAYFSVDDDPAASTSKHGSAGDSTAESIEAARP